MRTIFLKLVEALLADIHPKNARLDATRFFRKKSIYSILACMLIAKNFVLRLNLRPPSALPNSRRTDYKLADFKII